MDILSNLTNEFFEFMLLNPIGWIIIGVSSYIMCILDCYVMDVQVFREIDYILILFLNSVLIIFGLINIILIIFNIG